MKKFGFTLAELLITLGIIGIVASLTIPSIITNNTETQVGPKLTKAVTNFEQANKSLLKSQNTSALSDTRLLNTSDSTAYFEALSNHIKLSKIKLGCYISNDGMIYGGIPSVTEPENPEDPIHKQSIGTLLIFLDKSAATNSNIKAGSNTFYFNWMNDGSLLPVGGTGWNGQSSSEFNGSEHWTTRCPAGGSPVTNEDYRYCTGHIFENDLKILYK